MYSLRINSFILIPLIFCLSMSLVHAKNCFSFDRKELTQKAKLGDIEAQYSLAIDYYYDTKDPRNTPKAIKWFKVAAESGHAEAQYLLQHLYLVGDGVPPDKNESAKWFRKAAESGHAEAQFYLGLMYNTGKGLNGEKGPTDKKEAVKWLKKASDRGYAEAQFSLGYNYALGLEVPKSELMAYALWSLSAAQGNQNAIKYKNNLTKRLSQKEINNGNVVAEELQRKIVIIKKNNTN